MTVLELGNDMTLFSISNFSVKNIATKSDHFPVSGVLNLEIEQIGECKKLKWIESEKFDIYNKMSMQPSARLIIKYTGNVQQPG